MERLAVSRVAQIPERLREPIRYALAGGGKRLRAGLVILAGRLVEASPAACHDLAGAVEMLHAATLVHDDVLDGSPLRRGRQALHNSWPARMAVTK